MGRMHNIMHVIKLSEDCTKCTPSLIVLRDERPMAVDRLIVLRDEQPMAVDLKQLRCHKRSSKMPIPSQCSKNYYHAKPPRFKFIVSDIEEGEATNEGQHASMLTSMFLFVN